VEFWKSINVTELTLKIPRGGQAAAGIGGRLGGDGDDGGGGGDGGADGGGSEGGGKYGGEGDAGGGGDNGGGGGRDIGTGGDGTGSMVAGSDAHSPHCSGNRPATMSAAWIAKVCASSSASMVSPQVSRSEVTTSSTSTQVGAVLQRLEEISSGLVGKTHFPSFAAYLHVS